MEIPTDLPASWSAGSTWTYRRTIAGYTPADGTLALYLAGPGALSAVGVADGSAWLFTVTPAANATLPAGLYGWLERLTLTTGEVLDVASGSIAITPNLATATGNSLQSTDERLLAVVVAAIEKRLPKDWESFAIEGKSVSAIPMAELFRIRGELETRIRAAREAASGRFGTPVRLVFGPIQ